MRELTREEYAPTLSYAAATLQLGLLVFAYAVQNAVATSTLAILLAPIAALLVMHVHAEPWARLSGYLWAALLLLGGIVGLLALVLNGNTGPLSTLTGLSFLAAAIWVIGASMADEGRARALGAAVAFGIALAGLLDIVGTTIARTRWPLAEYVHILAVALFIAWLVLLARDLTAGRRKWRAVM